LSRLAALAAIFSQLSLVAFGGGNSVLPEMQRQVVHVHPWMTARQFAALYALAQAAPGPNMLVAALVGLRVDGIPGALISIGSLCAPSSLLTYACSGAWHRFRTQRWRAVVQAGLIPVTAGLVMAGAALLVRTTAGNLRLSMLIVAATAMFLFSRVHPLLVLVAAALLGATGLLA
jgi:chromate transporter